MSELNLTREATSELKLNLDHRASWIHAQGLTGPRCKEQRDRLIESRGPRRRRDSSVRRVSALRLGLRRGVK